MNNQNIYRGILVLLIVFVAFFIKPAKAFDLKQYYKEDLTQVDKANIVLFNVLQSIDMLQTLEIANNDAYYEKNPILGKHPSETAVVTYFIARGFAHYHATKMIPLKYRNIWQHPE